MERETMSGRGGRGLWGEGCPLPMLCDGFLYFSLSLFSGFPDFVKMYTGGEDRRGT